MILCEFYFHNKLYWNRDRLTSLTWFFILNSEFLIMSAM